MLPGLTSSETGESGSYVTICNIKVHCPTKNLTRRFVAPELFPRESFLSQQQNLK
jgi:hypothetical protein